MRYPVRGTPCEQVLGQRFRAYPDRLHELLPRRRRRGIRRHRRAMPVTRCSARTATPLGTVAIASRSPLLHVERIEAVLQIFAVRAAAEIERLRATRRCAGPRPATARSSRPPRTRSSSTTGTRGAIVDANPKACADYGYSARGAAAPVGGRPQLGRAAVHAERGAAQHRAGQAATRCPPFEWHRRNSDGSLHWDEVRAEAGADRRQAAHPGDHARDHRAQVGAGGAAGAARSSTARSSTAAPTRWGCGTSELPPRRRQPGLHAAPSAGHAMRWSAAGSTNARGEPDAAAALALIRGALAGREGRIEARVPTKDGPRLDVEMRYVPVQFRGRGVRAVRGARHHRAQRGAGRAARAARSSTARSSTAPSTRWCCGIATLRIVDVNAAFARMTGYARERGDRLSLERASRRATTLPRRADRAARSTAGPWRHAETSGARRDGSRFDIELRYLPMRSAASRIVLGVGRDISERLEPSAGCATARSSTAPSSTPPPTRWCCATPSSASSTSTRPTSA